MQDTRTLRSFSRCTTFCSADSYDLLGLSNHFRKKGYFTRLLRDVLHVTNLKRAGDIFFFNHGCFVIWGFKKKFEDKVLEIVHEYSSHPSPHPETDHFFYRYGSETTIDSHEKLRLDIITLATEDSQIKLAMSYGLAQSIKLEDFEEAIQATIRTNSQLPEEIALQGSISLSRRAIFKRIGEIFISRSSINLNIEYLDAPEYFWRNPSMEPYYILIQKYLDIPGRVMALNQKLDVLQELLHILNSQVQHRHSSLLETIIILLIFVEILISVFQLHIV